MTTVLTHPSAFVVAVYVERLAQVVNLRVVLALVGMSEAVAS